MKLVSPNQLMGSFKAGDEKAFEELYRRFKRPIFFYLLTTLKNVPLAEEITHETFLKIFQKKNLFDTQFSFTTWAWKIAHNLAIDKMRKKDPLYFSRPNEGDQFEELQDLEIDLDEILNKKLEREVLLHAIDELPAEQREIVSLRLYSELELQEIADVTQKKLSSVKTLFYRAQRAIKEKCCDKLEEVI